MIKYEKNCSLWITLNYSFKWKDADWLILKNGSANTIRLSIRLITITIRVHLYADIYISMLMMTVIGHITFIFNNEKVQTMSNDEISKFLLVLILS